MPRFRLRLEWEDYFADRDKAKEFARDIWEEIEQLGEDSGIDPPVLQSIDAQVIPRTTEPMPWREERERADEAGLVVIDAEVTEEMLLETPDHMRGEYETRGSMVPSMGVDHPWDKGTWIFPEDHELHDVEVEAKRRYEQGDDVPKRMIEGVAEAMQFPTGRPQPLENDETP